MGRQKRLQRAAASPPVARPEAVSPAPCPPRNSRGRNTRHEAQPSPASRGVGSAGPAGHVLERTGAPELWKRRRPSSPPVPGTARSGTPLSPLRRPNPGRSHGHRRDTPRPPSPGLARGVLMKEAPHHSGEHGLPQRPRTQGCVIPACPVDSPLRMDAEVCACGAQRLVDQEGKPRRHLVRDETGAIREPRRPHRLDHPDHPGRVPLHHQPTRRTPAA